MNKTERPVPKALREIWAIKDAIYQEVKGLPLDKAISAILDMAHEAHAEVQRLKRRPGRRHRGPTSKENRDYLQTKKDKMGHILDNL